MQDTNIVIVTGRLTRDPDGRRTNGGTAVTELGIACNGRKKQGDQWVDEACFLDVTVFGKSAEFCRDYLQKGNRVLIEASLKLDQWDDRTTGQKRSKLKLVAFKVQSLESPPSAQNGGYGQNPANPPNVPPAPRNAPQPPPFPGG